MLEFALKLQISVEEFDHLLDVTDATYPQKRNWREGKDRRFNTIKNCMERRAGFDETNRVLEEGRMKKIG